MSALYLFECTRCGEFEETVKMGTESTTCPYCGDTADRIFGGVPCVQYAKSWGKRGGE